MGEMTGVMIEKNEQKRLIGRAKRGDREAFEALLRAYEPRLRTAVELQVRECPQPLESGEVLQDTLVRAFESVGRFEWQGEDSFYHWLCGISRNVIHKLYDEGRKRRYLHVPGRVAGSNTAPSKAMRRQERHERLEEALAQLSSDYREVLSLSRLEGLTVREIAQRMGKSEFAVKHLMARAIRQLRSGFGDTEGLHLPDRPLSMGGDRDEGE